MTRHPGRPASVAMSEQRAQIGRAATGEALHLGLECIAFPGMGTGCGQVPYAKAAEAMWCGIVRAKMAQPGTMIGFPLSWQDAQKRHFDLAL